MSLDFQTILSQENFAFDLSQLKIQIHVYHNCVVIVGSSRRDKLVMFLK